MRSSGKSDSQSDGEESSDSGSANLSDELDLGLGSNQVTGLEVTSHIGGLGGGATSDETTNQVEPLCGDLSETLALGDTTEDKLGGFGDGGDGVDVGISGGLHTDEGEDETKDQSQDNLSDVHVELGGDEREGQQYADSQNTSPSP